METSKFFASMMRSTLAWRPRDLSLTRSPTLTPLMMWGWAAGSFPVGAVVDQPATTVLTKPDQHQIQSKELLDTLARLSEDSWSLRSRLLGFRPRTSACNEERVTSHQSTPSESNPKKAANDKLVEEERDAPARALRIPR
jgi:hypothetical protein